MSMPVSAMMIAGGELNSRWYATRVSVEAGADSLHRVSAPVGVGRAGSSERIWRFTAAEEGLFDVVAKRVEILEEVEA